LDFGDELRTGLLSNYKSAAGAAFGREFWLRIFGALNTPRSLE
jgi:hypothetical protein